MFGSLKFDYSKWRGLLLSQICGFCSLIAPKSFTVELQWLEHLWDHRKLFEIWVVRATDEAIIMSTHNIQFHDKIRISLGLKNEFELAMVNEPSVFELLRFDCISNSNT